MAGLSPGGDESQQLPGASKPKKTRSTSRLRISSVEEIEEREEPKWTVFSGSQNLAAALNDPVCREYDLFTKTWGSYFIPNAPLPALKMPNIELGDFLRYLKETSAGRKSHRAIVRQLKKEAQEASNPVSPGPITLRHQLQQDGRTYDMGSIPRIFMQSDFSLKDPPTFQEVFPLSQLLPPRKRGGEPQRTTQQTSKLLHEKLTHYLDIIEVHLTYHISQRSDVFFSTLSSQQELQTHIMQVRHQVVEIRHKLREMDRELTHRGLQLVRLCTLRSRYNLVHQKLKLIATVQQTQPTIQLLLSTSDFVGALDLITTTQDVLEQELQGVHGLRHLGSQLAELEKAIERMMEADFVLFALEDIQWRLQEARQGTPCPEGADSEERLVSVVYGLLRQGKLHFLTALREELFNFLKAQVKEIVRNYLQIPEMEAEGEEPPSLADRMRGMEFDVWEAMLDHLFDSLLVYMNTVQSSLNVIANVCKTAAGREFQATREASLGNKEPTKKAPRQESGFSPPSQSTSIPEEEDAATPKDLRTVMESFEASTAEQEAADRLEKLLLEDELSDARIGIGTTAGTVGAVLTPEAADVKTVGGGPSHYTSPGGSNSRGSGSKVGEENSVRARQLEQLGRRDPRVATLERPQQEFFTTLDSKEKERLEDNMAIAGIEDAAVISPSDCKKVLRECHEILNAACDLIHARCAKILSIRAKAGLLENLLSSDFVSLVRLIERFVSRSVRITGFHCPTLRSSLLTQAREFLEHFHETRRGKLSLLLDGERWKQADVPAEIQSLVNAFEAGIPPNPGGHPVVVPEGQLSQFSPPPSKYLVIRGQSFAVVGIVLLLIKIVMEYCQCADDLPMLVNEVMSKLMETLKYFNSRTCQLVLGAGAVEAVGLKTITARHLALVSRCLQAIMLLIPNFRRHFQQRLASKQHILLTQFDKVIGDFSSHCREINIKVMTIMDELILKHLSKWEVKSPIPSPCFKTLTKQVIKLHENLVDILPREQLQALFNGIEQIFKTRLRMQLVKLGITNNGSTQHGIVNSELTHFKGALGSLENITAFGNTLFDVWTINR